MKKNLLITLADKKFVNQAKQLFSSVYYNSGWKGDYMLLADGMKKEDVKYFKEKGIIVKDITHIKFIKESHIGANENIWPSTVLAKLTLFTKEFKKWDKIIFLDSDIMIRGSINELLKVNTFAAIEDHYPTLGIRFKDYTLLETRKQIEAKKNFVKNYNQRERCFNSGVLAINTNIIKDETFNELLEILNRYGEISYGDEPLLNLYFYKKWQKLSKVYNACVPYWKKHYGVQKEEVDCPILHFISRYEEDKPWYKENQYYEEWKASLDKFDSIDLNKTFKCKIKYTKSDIYKFENLLKSKRFKIVWALLNPLYYFDKDRPVYFDHNVDEFLGKIGILLKIYLPHVYILLRRNIKR